MNRLLANPLDKEIYIFAEFYEKKMLNCDIAKAMRKPSADGVQEARGER